MKRRERKKAHDLAVSQAQDSLNEARMHLYHVMARLTRSERRQQAFRTLYETEREEHQETLAALDDVTAELEDLQDELGIDDEA